MSFCFDVDGTTVWFPALRVGQMFVGCAQVLADVVGSPTGLTFMAADYAYVDPLAMGDFVAELLKLNDNHQELRGLVDGVLLPCLVMLQRAGHTVDLGNHVRRSGLIQGYESAMAD